MKEERSANSGSLPDHSFHACETKKGRIVECFPIVVDGGSEEETVFRKRTTNWFLFLLPRPKVKPATLLSSTLLSAFRWNPSLTPSFFFLSIPPLLAFLSLFLIRSINSTRNESSN